MQKEFIRVCVKAVDSYKPLDIEHTSSIIREASEKLPGHVNPMLTAISELAWDLAEGYQSETTPYGYSCK